MKRFISAFLLLAVLTTGALAGGVWLWLDRTVAPRGEAKEILIPAGSSARAIGQILNEAGLEISPDNFALATRLLRVAHRLQAGVYAIPAESSFLQVLRQVTRGDALQAPITLIEGWTFAQILAALHSHPHVRPTLPADPGQASRQLAAALGYPGSAIEGWLYPDTYFFHRGQTDAAILTRAFRLQQRILEEAWARRSDSVAVRTPQEALILASIIEKETQHGPDRGRVSAVFHNRLSIGMRLQSDPTTIYGLGARFDGNLRRDHLQDASPYNTYRWGGLPPGPIANPGRAAIMAAVTPVPSKALYFVAQGNGRSYFSETLDRHNWAVNYFQRRVGPPPPEEG
ncbi:MAG: endolytic transglycosylase MltG [Burkholderiaceae bacterium]